VALSVKDRLLLAYFRQREAVLKFKLYEQTTPERLHSYGQVRSARQRLEGMLNHPSHAKDKMWR
jgi:hypothetical protein